MIKLKEFVQKYWKYAVVAVICLLLGSVGGFFGKPAEVKYQEKTVYKDRVVEKVVTNTQTVEVENKTKILALTRKIKELQKPDGTKETTTEETFGSTEAANKTETKVVVEYRDRIVEKLVTKDVIKTVKNQPNWIVSAGVGVSIPKFLGRPEIGIPGLQGAVIQAEIGRRIAGPFYLGLFGNSQGVVGLNLSGTF